MRAADNEDDGEASSGRASFSEASARHRLLADLLQRPDLAEVLKKKLEVCTSHDVLEEIAGLLVHAGLFAAEEEEAAASASLLSTSAETRPVALPAPEGHTISPQGTWKKASSMQKGGMGVTRQSSQPLLGRKGRASSAHLEGTLVPVDMAPPPPVVTLEARLRGLLEEPASSPEVVKFVAYLESCFAVENFNFLKDVAEYDAIPPASKAKERKARKIYETYFVGSSPSLINMSHRAAAPVVNRYGPLSPNIFALAVKAVKQNLQDDILVRYLEMSKRESGGEDAAALEGLKFGLMQRLGSRGSNAGEKEEVASPPLSPPSGPAAPYESLSVTPNPLLALNSSGPSAVPYESLNVVQNPLLHRGRKQRAQSDSRTSK